MPWVPTPSTLVATTQTSPIAFQTSRQSELTAAIYVWTKLLSIR